MTNIQTKIKDGTRDYIFEDAKLKRQIINGISSLFEANGYSEVITPSFEYYAVFNPDNDPDRDETIYKFTDEKNRTIALRSDCTMPIARIAATKLIGEQRPYRLFYCQNIFNSFSGDNHSLLETTQSGIEYIGADNPAEADLEVIKIAIMTLRQYFKDDFRLEIGHGKLFGILTEYYGIDPETSEQARKLIEMKNFAALENMNLPAALKMLPKVFGQMTNSGDADNLLEFEKEVGSNQVSEILNYIRTVFKELSSCGYEKYLSFDLGMVHRLDYYTGVIFDGFVYGSGRTVLSGGRYDNLICKYGRDLSAIGFGLNIEDTFDILKMAKRRENK